MPRFEEGTGRLIPDPATLSPQDFMDRFPAAIIDMITTHQVRDTPVGAAIRKALLRFSIVREVDPMDLRTISDTEDMVDLAIALEVIASADRHATLEGILAPVT